MIRSFLKDKIFVYYFIAFIFFTALVIVFQFSREKHFRQGEFESILDNVTGTTSKYLELNHRSGSSGNDYESIDSLIRIIPVDGIRISIISTQGVVQYDSYVNRYQAMENHSTRPEVIKALKNGKGSSIRISKTTGKEYFYYARVYNGVIIRAAAEYTHKVKSFLRIDKLFLLVISALFLLVWTAFVFVNYRFRKATFKLKEFVVSTSEGREDDYFEFPRSELGSLGYQLVDIYRDLKEKRDKLENDQDRIFRHLQTMEEGIAIFTSDEELVLSNEAFIQNANLLSNRTVNSPEQALQIKDLQPVMNQIREYISEKSKPLFEEEHFKEIICQKQNRYFLVRGNMFSDFSFELIIKNVTKSEKSKVLKQQLTSNIAHELRTPVTSIVGFLETLLDAPVIDEEKKMQFLERARFQANRLAELIDHISMINKLEEATDYYRIENVNVNDVLSEVIDSMKLKADRLGAAINVNTDPELVVPGNRVLFHSIFQNLLENTLNYAGENITINISRYYEDSNYHYFRYSNTGKSIPEQHMNRLFERFYRIDEGRARNRGGSGLGLAIVKHAVQFHRGQISVKNLADGGVEFQFTISKNQS